MSSDNKQQPCFLCGKPASLRCSKCRIEPYCSVEHQKVLWVTHKYVCGHQEPFFRMPDFTLEECGVLSTIMLDLNGNQRSVEEKRLGDIEVFHSLQEQYKTQTPEARTDMLAQMRNDLFPEHCSIIPSNMLPFYYIAREMYQGFNHFEIKIESVPKEHYLYRLATSTARSPRAKEGVSTAVSSQWREYQDQRIKDEILRLKNVKDIGMWCFFSFSSVEIAFNFDVAKLRSDTQLGILSSAACEALFDKIKSDHDLSLKLFANETAKFKRENNF